MITLLIKEIRDRYIQENFIRIRDYINKFERVVEHARYITAGRPSGKLKAGDTIFNLDTKVLETWDGTKWVSVLDYITGSGSGAANVVLINVPCHVSVFLGAAVKMTSGTAYNAQADVYANSNVVGLVEEKPSSTLCNIRVTGLSLAVFAGLDETKDYFLSSVSAGAITITPPSGPGNIVLAVGKPFNSTQMVVIQRVRMERS